MGARLKAQWRASWRWPVIWRRFVVIFVAMQLWNVGYLAVRGFETVAHERQKQALLNPSSFTWDQLTALDKATKAQAAADQALASYYCSIGVNPQNAGLNFVCR